MTPTDLKTLYPAPVPPDRLSWHDKIALNALGLVGVALVTIFVCGLYAIYTWAMGLT